MSIADGANVPKRETGEARKIGKRILEGQMGKKRMTKKKSEGQAKRGNKKSFQDR